jgi:hypothetical protein
MRVSCVGNEAECSERAKGNNNCTPKTMLPFARRDAGKVHGVEGAVVFLIQRHGYGHRASGGALCHVHRNSTAHANNQLRDWGDTKT